MRKTIKDDMIYFAIPGIIVLSAGMAANGWDMDRMYQGGYIFTFQSYVGVAMVILGLANNITSAITLNRFYSSTLVIREEHQLIQHGTYRYVRHPIYLGVIMVFCFGIPIFVRSIYGFLAMLLVIPVILNRIRMEENMLTEEFGDDYRKYKATTCKLIPFIY